VRAILFMDFLEKDLEDIIFESDNNLLMEDIMLFDSLELDNYTYSYSIDGIEFNIETGYKLSEEGF